MKNQASLAGIKGPHPFAVLYRPYGALMTSVVTKVAKAVTIMAQASIEHNAPASMQPIKKQPLTKDLQL